MELTRIKGVGPATAKAIVAANQRDDAADQFAAAERHGARLLTIWDAEYPHLLRNSVAPPVVLWHQGQPAWLSRPTVAVVGTRTPTDYGLSVAGSFTEALSSAGFCVVSGFAIGIDVRAHRQCLRQGRSTIAVFGSGLDVVYPARHRALTSEIARHGALLSEFAFGTAPEAGNFPRRNRIIAGMCSGVLVVEARISGGASSTARLALDLNREVFAVPGPISSAASSGCLTLIQRGEAMLVRRPEDVLEVLGPAARESATTNDAALSPAEALIWECLGDGVKHVDELCVGTALDISTVLSTLLRWEFSGAVYKMPNDRYRRCKRSR